MGAREDSFKQNRTVVTSMKKIQLEGYCKAFHFSTKKRQMSKLTPHKLLVS